MKLYTKRVDGVLQVLPAHKIVVVKHDMQIFNPTEEMLLDDEWRIYEPEQYEPTEEEILRNEIQHLKDDILRYGSSTHDVDIFYVNDVPMWLDKETRTGLSLRFNAELATGQTETSLWYDTLEFKLPTESAVQLLYALELYASKCFDNTHKQLAEAEKLTSVEEVKKFDITAGYPEKLRFTF